MSLREKIEREIREHGPIPFSRYMQLCLYDPELGYYSRNVEQFGRAGDFYTSSDVHAVFGRLLARQFEEMWRLVGAPGQIEILELGPGRGLFAQDVLDWAEKKFPEFFAALHYSLAERSPVLQRRLQATLKPYFESGKVTLSHAQCTSNTQDTTFETLPMESAAKRRKSAAQGASPGFEVEGSPAPEGRKNNCSQEILAAPRGADFDRAWNHNVPLIIFANEFVDALPVEVLSTHGELRIGVREGHLIEVWAPQSGDELDFIDRYGVHPEAEERIEAPIIAQDYVAQFAAMVESGFFVAIDYGYTRQEQLAGRHRGTVTAYRNHSVSASPYDAPGEQDLTAHVNFTALAEALRQNGMQVQPLVTQSQFLLGIGEANQFADAFEGCRLPQERVKVSLQLKHLVTPAGLGESFHVLVASNGVPAEQAAGLSGLSFGRTQREISAPYLRS
jgi:SAM-dependent MidA family methyltransferase